MKCRQELYWRKGNNLDNDYDQGYQMLFLIFTKLWHFFLLIYMISLTFNQLTIFCWFSLRFATNLQSEWWIISVPLTSYPVFFALLVDILLYLLYLYGSQVSKLSKKLPIFLQVYFTLLKNFLNFISLKFYKQNRYLPKIAKKKPNMTTLIMTTTTLTFVPLNKYRRVFTQCSVD